jgi:hypothetical protein
VILELGVCSFLIQAGQAAIASHIGCQDGSEATLDALAGQDTPPRYVGVVYASRFREPSDEG